jgi:signal recognition particle receptor subunit beta
MEHKIIFAGPVGAGKTTAIGTISDIPVVQTEAKASDDVVLRKANTTVAMDYGTLGLDGGAKIHLYGTPGQERFSFMWEILTLGGLGLVLLIDNAREDPLADLEFYLKSFQRFIGKSALVVGVTRMDDKPRPGLYSFHTKLKELGIKAPVFEVDAREREDVKTLLMGLLAMLDPGVRR